MSHFRLSWINQYLIKQPTVIFDIGSYNGAQAKVFKSSFEKARIIAIEADLNLFSKMKNDKTLKNIEMYNYAVCHKDGTINFHHNTGKKRGSGSIKEPSEKIFKFEGMSFSKPYEIPSIRIDTLCSELSISEIDIIHMDIQSAEYEAILGFGKVRPKMIFLEVSALNFYKQTSQTSNILMEMEYEKINIHDITKGDELWILKK